ncbi:MAG: hypothetical protein CUN50_05860, partial [Candidatus Thermofonsia Clade 1 bacterium]
DEALSEPAESAVSELDLDWLSAAPDLSAPQADESAPGLDWMIDDLEIPSESVASEPVTPDSPLPPEELAAIQADPLAWMSDFGLSAVPTPEAPHVELDEADLAELEAQLATSDNWDVSMTPDEPRSLAQIAGEMSAEAMQAWLQEHTLTSETFEAEARALPSADALQDFAQSSLNKPSTAAVQPPDSIILEDEWLAAFEVEPNVPSFSAPAQSPEQPEMTAEAATDLSAEWSETPEIDFGSAESPEWLTDVEQPLSETGLLRAEADRAFDQLLEQARRAANTPRSIGDTGVLSPDSLPDWLSAFDENAAAESEMPSAEPTADLSVEALFGDAPSFEQDVSEPSWLSQQAEVPAAEPPSAEPLAAFPDLTDTTDAPLSDLQTHMEDEPLTFTFKKPPAWKRKRSGKVE